MWKASGACFRDMKGGPGDKSCVETNELTKASKFALIFFPWEDIDL